MKTNLWLTVLTIALVLNTVMMQNKVDGDECTSGIRKEHLDPTPGHFVDGQTIQIGANGLEVPASAVRVVSQSGFTAMSTATEYTAPTDGFVVAYMNSMAVGSTMQAMISESAGAAPTVIIQNYQHNTGYGAGIPNFCFPVPAGFKWRVNSSVAATVKWMCVFSNCPVLCWRFVIVMESGYL